MTAMTTDERADTRARVKYVRSSAYKAREILDLIRGKSYAEASEILAFSERSISEQIAKVLDSAVANAEHNDDRFAEELFVSSCYADEGPTLKRWRPRARGRATRIRKRTCHITVIVTRYSDEQLEALREREAGVRSTTATAAEARRRRVEQSREREEAREVDHDHDHEEPSVEAQAAQVVAATEEALADSEVDRVGGEAEPADAGDDTDATPFGPLSHAPLGDPHEMPEGYPVKGNADSMEYHVPDGRWYDQTVAEVWFATTDAAEAAGFTEAGSEAGTGEEDS